MDKIKLAVSLPFPIFKLNNLVKYYEVKKPTGVAYMILVLINESKSNTLFSKILETFGVPENLQFIFAKTIRDLIEEDVLICKQTYNMYSFNEYKINEFAFTDKGRKIFRDEAIPTGKALETKIEAYYEIPFKRFCLKLPSELEGEPLMDTVFDSKFMQQFSVEKDIEEFFNSKKSAGILIKKEEIITEAKIIENSNWIGKYDTDVYIDGNKVEIKFESEYLTDFFKKYYTKDMFSKSLLYKNKFKFPSVFTKDLDLSNYTKNETTSIRLPSDLYDIQKQNAKLSLSKGNYEIVNSNIKIVDSNAISSIDKNIELIKVDKADNVYAYIPGNFVFTNDIVGEVNINLLVQTQLTKEQFTKIVNFIVNDSKQYSLEEYEKIIGVTSISRQFDLAIFKLKEYLTDDYAKNFNILNEVKHLVELNSKILEGYKEIVTNNFIEYSKLINKNNLETFIKVCGPLKKYINIDANEQIKCILNNLESDIDNVEKFELLSEYGFDANILSVYINPIPEMLYGKDVKNKNLLDVLNFTSNFYLLKKISGIEDMFKFTFDIDELNKNEFKKTFITAKSFYSKINMFRTLNKKLFNEFDLYMNVFSRINDEINMFEEVNKNPNKISKEYIEKKITSGDYQSVLLNLGIKLANVLKNNFSIDANTLSDALHIAKINKLIDRQIIDDLYMLKECRNAQVHPEDREKVEFTVDDLRRWSKLVFDLEENKK